MSLGSGVLGAGVLGIGEGGAPGITADIPLFGFDGAIPITVEAQLFGLTASGEASFEKFVDSSSQLFGFVADGRGGALSSATLFGFEASGEASQELIVKASAKLFGFEADGHAYFESASASAKLFGFEANGMGGAFGNSQLFGFYADASATQEQIANAEAELFGFVANSRLAFNGTAFDAQLFGFTADGMAGLLASAGLFGFEANAGVTVQVSWGQAFVMNAATNQVTRYQNMPFFKIITVAGIDFGVKSDGLYQLTGDTDYDPVLPVDVNATIVTKDFDFGSYKSKRVPYAYLHSDTETKITPYVDSVEKLPHLSSFGGRKTHLARGPSGRFWKFKIEQIRRLDGVEFLPELGERQRRIK